MSNNDTENAPRFKVEGTRENARVFLHCNVCDARIKEIFPKETVSVTRAYYCPEHEDNVIGLNPPMPTKNKPKNRPK